MNENNWNLEYPKLDRTLVRVLLIFLKIILTCMLLIFSLALITKINIIAVVIIDVIILLTGLFIRKIEQQVLMRIEIVNGIIYKINKYNHKKEIGNINEITSIKRHFLGISVLKKNKVLFSFSLRVHNDSKSFYKYLTHKLFNKQNISQVELKIKSYKRYNIFGHIFLTIDCLFISVLFFWGAFLQYNTLSIQILCIIFAILLLYAVFDEFHYILYTVFKLKPCSFNIEKDQVSFSILKVSASKKRRFNPTYSASAPYSRHSKGYKGILVKEDISLKIDDIINVDFVINLDMNIPNSYLTHASILYNKGLDITIITKEINYFILSDLFSRNDMEKIYIELKSRIKDTNF